VENLRRGGARTHFLRRGGIPGTPRNGWTPRVTSAFSEGGVVHPPEKRLRVDSSTKVAHRCASGGFLMTRRRAHVDNPPLGVEQHLGGKEARAQRLR
jgi:hypothetical protein